MALFIKITKIDVPARTNRSSYRGNCRGALSARRRAAHRRRLGYVVRPPRARREKPRVSAFTSADVPKILDLKPDLVLTFSDLQADIAATLICHGIEVHAFNQRTVLQILDMIKTLGALIGAADRAERLAQELAASVAGARRHTAQLPCRPKVYFEEWDDPMISGIGWVSELVEVAGGSDIFCRSSFLQASQGPHRDGGGNNPSLARHHHRLLVRQEIPTGESRPAARFRLHPLPFLKRTNITSTADR